MNVYILFKNGQCTTIVISKLNKYRDATEHDYIVYTPNDAEKQIEEWIKENR